MTETPDSRRLIEDALKDRILEVASRLLRAEGPRGLSMRRIASETGTTTMTLYNRYGGKNGITEALVREAFQRVRDAQAEVPSTSTAVADIVRLCDAYRGAAREYHQHYTLIFEDPHPLEGRGSPEDGLVEVYGEVYLAIVTAVFRALDAKRLEGDAEIIGAALLAACHGHVHLELSGLLPTQETAESHFRELIRAVLRGFSPQGRGARLPDSVAATRPAPEPARLPTRDPDDPGQPNTR